MDKKIIQKSSYYITVEERHKIIQEWLSSGCSKQEIWRKYTGDRIEHGRLLRWMKALGYERQIQSEMVKIVKKSVTMSGKKNKPDKVDEDFEKLQLKKRISELEKQLKDAELKAIAFSTMVDIAEKEFNIPIRKKFNTKP